MGMEERKLAKAWLYFRTGYSYYFVFLVSGLNALMIAYFVVILGTTCDQGKSLTEQGDILCLVRYAFPHFAYFVAFAIGVGTPMLIGMGYWHYSKHQFGTHAHIEWGKNPYQKVTLSILLELIGEVKLQNKYSSKKVERLEVIEDKLKTLLDDKNLDD